MYRYEECYALHASNGILYRVKVNRIVIIIVVNDINAFVVQIIIDQLKREISNARCPKENIYYYTYVSKPINLINLWLYYGMK